MKRILLLLGLIASLGQSFGQASPLDNFNFLIGEWVGVGTGIGNETSIVKTSFQFELDRKYIEVINESKFAPSKNKPEGEHHIDKGFISYDSTRKVIVYRQFNSEGYINQYLLVESLSTNNSLVFETEAIENFVSGGKARWTLNRTSENKIEIVIDVLFPTKNYTRIGTNKLNRKEKITVQK